MSKKLIAGVTLGVIGAVGLVWHFISKRKNEKDKKIKIYEPVLIRQSLPVINIPKITTEDVSTQTRLTGEDLSTLQTRVTGNLFDELYASIKCEMELENIVRQTNIDSKLRPKDEFQGYSRRGGSANNCQLL